MGYADGYSWRLSNRAEMLVGETRAPVVGAVSMDMTLIDLTETAAGLGEEVVLLGRQGDAGDWVPRRWPPGRARSPTRCCVFWVCVCRDDINRAGRDVAFDSRFTH